MRILALGVTLAVLLPASRAMADAQQCIAENELATKQRAAGKLGEAKQHYLACAAAECPAVVRDECQSLSQKMETSLPTVVFVLVDAKGNDVTGARVFIDDAKAAEPLDGHALVLDPGNHRISVEAPSGASIEQTVVAREGEKNRRIRIQLPAAPKRTTDVDTVVAPAQPSTRAAPSPVVWVLSGVAVVGLGSFAYFGLNGKHQENDLKSRCAPVCKDAEVDDMYRSYLIADVSLGVSVVAASVAGYLFFSTPPSGSPSTAKAKFPFDFRVGAQGASVTYAGSFR
jgi:hypothetical protein